MAQIKCIDCGQVFDNKLADCPKCGCPASECEIVTETPVKENVAKGDAEDKNKRTVSNETRTTDTGYLNEKALARCADIIFICASVGYLLLYIVILLVCGRTIHGVPMLVVSIIGCIITAIYIVGLLIAKAFVKIYANMSINLHEINMKLK